MREKWQNDVQQVEELAAVAGVHLHCAHQHCATALCYWSRSHKACIPACVALACVRQCVNSWLPLQIFIFYPTITLCCGILLYYALVLHSQKHAFLHVLRMNVCNKNAILCSIMSLTFCGFRVIFASFDALLTELTTLLEAVFLAACK